jgi:proline dehydrogenase
MADEDRVPKIVGAWAWLLAVAALVVLTWRHGHRWLRNGLIYLSHAAWARDLVTRMPLAWRVASRFVAGESSDDAIAACRELNELNLLATLDFLGESVSLPVQAIAAREEIEGLLGSIAAARVRAGVSVKLTQLGMQIDEALALDNMRRLLTRARELEIWVRIDMEDSPWTDTTLRIFRTLRQDDGFDNVGVVIQSYLYRSHDDVAALVADGASVRLCKGAYAEPPGVAFPRKADTDASFVRLMKSLMSDEALANGVYAAIATHDDAMIEATLSHARRHNIPPQKFEFQMLYGIRPERQLALVNQGYQMRVYVPYGTAWYPYFMRRLAERPANLWFFVSNYLRR